MATPRAMILSPRLADRSILSQLDRQARLRAVVPSRRAGLCSSLRAPLLGSRPPSIIRAGLGHGCQQEACAETKGETDGNQMGRDAGPIMGS